MAVRHINPSAREESGIFLTGEDAKKVFNLFSDKNRDKKIIKQKQERFNTLLKKSIEIATR